MTTARHIKSLYRIVNDEMLVYAGPLEIPVAGSTEVKEGDLVISFTPRPALQARLAGQEDWLQGLLWSFDPLGEGQGADWRGPRSALSVGNAH